VVAIFVIFGAVLNAGEAGQGFMNIASAAAGRLKGGAAKVSVISSALFGSISGSASANVASTGAITLPAMTRLGYPKRLAAAVEAVASSGGQIMPPLMGAGAFVMVELTGVPYTEIMAAALLPAFLYFFAVWIGINGYASRYELAGLAKEDRPDLRAVIITSAFFAIPFAVLMWGMFAARYTPQFAACMAILVGFVMLFFHADGVLDMRRVLGRLEQAVVTAARQVSMIAAIILCASIIIGVLSITGLGVKITSLILSASGGMLWPSLLLTALACLVLGMEVPTTAAYVICVSVAGPALTKLGLEPAAGASVRVLVRAAVDDHAAGLRRSLHCRRHDRRELAEGRGHRHEPWPRPLHHSADDGCQSGDHGPCERARCGHPGTGADRTGPGADLLCVDRRVHAVAPCSAWFGGICGVVWSSYAGLNLFGPLLRPPYEVMSPGPARPRCVGS
jgi:TRAP transporter 4TM/12TM fusion protein